ncbi:MAG: tetratricopeptide repeat protein [Magnetococcales bacterium]|nr:tetratricopeptide repeat protein [Magnetococcales bacterium]
MKPRAKHYYTLAVEHYKQQRYSEAVACFQQVLIHQPDHAIAHYNLATLIQQHQTGQLETAEQHYRQAIALKPDYAHSHYNLALLLDQRGATDEARHHYQTAIRYQSDYTSAHYNLGLLLQRQGDYPLAADHYRQAIALQPDYADAHFALAMNLLSQGIFATGWQEYRWRFQTERFRWFDELYRSWSQPPWDGSELNGRTILLMAEQGYGDTIQFSRYISRVAARGGRVILACQPPLHPLMATLTGIDRIIPQQPPWPEFDTYAPLLCLPRIFADHDHGWEGPYLHPDLASTDLSGLTATLASHGKLRVGLAWAGNPQHPRDDQRSIHQLERLAPLFELPGIEWFSLQLGASSFPGPMRDLSPLMQTFTDSAALLKQLDLLITVDTVLLHLAASLGLPVWGLLAFNPDWRWMRDRHDSPWYPSLRLFRQSEVGDWSGVIDQVVAALQQHPALVTRPARPAPTDSLQQPKQVAVVIQTLLRPTLLQAVESVYQQRHIDSLHLLIGVDKALGDPALLDQIEARRPPHCTVTLINLGYSTCRMNGGLHPAYGGVLRTTLSYLANSRYLAYLDDDNWWHPDHLHTLLTAIASVEWAFSLRILTDSDGTPLMVDLSESVGPDGGLFQERFGGFVDTNCLMIDKLACEPVLRLWSQPLSEDGKGEDRVVFRELKNHYAFACSGRATAYYRIDPTDPLHQLRLQNLENPSDQQRCCDATLLFAIDHFIARQQQNLQKMVQRQAKRSGRASLIGHCTPSLQPLRHQGAWLTLTGRQKRNPLDWTTLDDFRFHIAGPFDCHQAATDSITPYCLDSTNQQLIAVAADSQALIEQGPFYQAQYQHATALAALPWSILPHCYPADADRRLIFVHAIGCCGSEQLGQALRATGQVTWLAEPDCYTQLASLRNDQQTLLPQQTIRELVPPITELLCRPYHRHDRPVIAIQLRSHALAIADWLASAYPAAHHLFLSRPATDWIAAAHQAFGATVEQLTRQWQLLQQQRQQMAATGVNFLDLDYQQVIDSPDKVVQQLSEYGCLGGEPDCYALGLAKQHQNDPAAAADYYRRAVAENPRHVDAWNNLGTVLDAQNNRGEAMTCYQRALEIDPSYATAHYNIGFLMQQQQRYDEAEQHYRQALQSRPGYAAAWNNLANLFHLRGALDQAADHYQQALQHHPDSADTHFNLAILYLLQGLFEQGWQEYQWRRIMDPYLNQLGQLFHQPLWQGEALENRRILIVTEQGFGDTLQFARYLPLVAQRGGTIILACQSELVDLMSRVTGVRQIVSQKGPWPEFDVWLPLLCLPQLFQTRADNIPHAVPYVSVDPKVMAKWRQQLGQRKKGTLRVGLAWAGRPSHPQDQARSIHALQLFKPLLRVAKIEWFSLQTGAAAQSITQMPVHTVRDLSPLIETFMDSAAILCQIDLLISVDTALLHLAGALNRPAWALLQAVPDWRWLQQGDQSPWYPSLRLFRQQRANHHWPEVMARVAAALRQQITRQPPRHHDASADELYHQGNALLRQGEAQQAIDCYQQALQLDPDLFEAYHNLATVLYQQGRLQEALEHYQTILARWPDSSAAHNNLGALLQDQGDLAAAAESFQRAIDHRPDYADAYGNLANVRQKQQRWQEALASYQKQLALRPNDGTVLFRMGLMWQRQHHYQQALDCYQRTLAIDPNHADAWNNRGMICQLLGDLTTAAASYRQALTIQPDLAAAHFNLAINHLVQGDFAAGWQEYAWRRQMEEHRNFLRDPFKQPPWDGRPLQGQRILILAEQGLGDTLQFARYIPMVAERGGQVLLACQPELHGMMTGLSGIHQLLPQKRPWPAFDSWAPLLCLPRIFQTDLATIPTTVPYLAVSRSLYEQWGHRLPPASARMRVGLVWRGSAGHDHDHLRSIHDIAHLQPLLALDNIDWFTLQPIMADDQAVLEHNHVTDLWPQIRSFMDSAAILCHLDLLISVDTSILHLAGAIGRPAWGLLAFNPDWRWLLQRQDTPWYQTLQLLRQSQPNDWPELIGRVVAALQQQCQQHQGRYYFEQGLQSQQQQQWPPALAAYQQALQHGFDAAEIYNNVGVIRQQQQRYSDATDCFRAAVAQRPDFAEAWNNMGTVLDAQNEFQQSYDCYQQALALKPDYATAWYNFGLLMQRQDRYDEADHHYRQAIALRPDYADAWNNLANVSHLQGHFDAAIACYHQAIAHQADAVAAHFNLAIIQLLHGDFSTGWQGYAWRRQMENHRVTLYDPFEQPPWDGRPLQGQRILIITEQGFGDTIQFIRYLPLVAARGGRITLACQKRLHDLVALLADPVIDQIIAQQPPWPEFDHYAPLLCLPRIFGTDLDSIPCPIPYLRVDPEVLEQWQQRLPPRQPSSLRVALVWAGRPSHEQDRSRTLHHLELLAPLFTVSGVEWFSLQLGPQAALIDQLPGSIHDLSPHITSFIDTAAILQQVDLLITVDTSVLHLAGALGRPVWGLISYVPDWRWLLERQDSPWYPSLRLFRQQQPGDWLEVIGRVADELRHMADH